MLIQMYMTVYFYAYFYTFSHIEKICIFGWMTMMNQSFMTILVPFIFIPHWTLVRLEFPFDHTNFHLKANRYLWIPFFDVSTSSIEWTFKNTFFGYGIIDEEEQYGKQIVYPYQVSQSFTLFSFFSMFADQQKI